MIIIFAGLRDNIDPQIRLVRRAFQARGLRSIVLTPYSLRRNQVTLTQVNNRISLQIRGELVRPTAFYMANLWRTDSIICPQEVLYPSVYRSKIHQFLHDIRFGFEDCKWIPGRIEDIERGDSKIALFMNACNVDLVTPRFTQNSFSLSLSKDRVVFKKKLGYPFIISLNSTKGIEVGVTTENQPVTLGQSQAKHREPWQWQEAICAKARVRSCVVGKSIWSVISTVSDKSRLVDLRRLNETGRKVSWRKYQLPVGISRSIIALMQNLGLSTASPEFLIKDDGTHVFIDLNPCGDWAGFFPKTCNQEIAEKIASLAVQ